MLIMVHPIKLSGSWDVGYALDTHVVSSVCLGEDPYGRPVFENTRSEIGELLYQFKYQGGRDNLLSIVETIVDFMSTHAEMQDFDTIIPVPPTPEKYRPYHPTLEIEKALASATHVFCCEDVLEKNTTQQLKGMSF